MGFRNRGTQGWLAVFLRQHGAFLEALVRFFKISSCSWTSLNSIPAFQSYLLSLWIWPGYILEKESIYWGTLLGIGTTFYVECLFGDKAVIPESYFLIYELSCKDKAVLTIV